MIPYYILILVPLFIEIIEYSLYNNSVNKIFCRTSNISIIIFFVIWCIMLSLRSTSCGIDLMNYEPAFYSVQKLDFLKIFDIYPIEKFYFALNWIVGRVYQNFQFFLTVVAFLCTTVLGWFYWRESEFAPLTILLFVTNACFPMFFSGLRQSLAMLFVVPAYYFTKNKKILLFVITVCLAYCFHTSAAIMILLYPFFHISIKNRYFILVLSLVALFFIFSSQIFTKILPMLGDRYVDRYGEIVATNAYSMWLMLTLFLIYSFVIPDERKMDHEMFGARNILILIVLIQSFSPISSIAMRMNYYYLLLFPVFFSKILNRSKIENLIFVQYSKWGMVLFFIFYFFYNAHMGGDLLQLYPYVAYWE